MVRYQVILAYDGTDFCGFQRQARDRKGRTVQSVLEEALRQIGWQGKSVLAAGRTDTGVHAFGQVVAFDLDWAHSTEALEKALNAHLPKDLAVRQALAVRANFHPRYDALSRRYCYRIFCQALRNPLKERYAWRVWPPVDRSRLMKASEALPGVHDFSAFGTSPRVGGTTVRRVLRASWEFEEEGFYLFDIVADAFLYRMVRRLVKLLVEIGQGSLPVEVVQQSLESGRKMFVKGMAPPQGLTLMEVTYPPAMSD
jgi:tRNA pseudouridine38-40 synthase